MGKKIVLFSGVTLFAFSLAFAGCGKKEEPAPPPEASAPAEPAAGGTTEGAGEMAPSGGEAAPANPCAPQAGEMKEEGTKAQ